MRVHGEGPRDAKLVFVGEAPGYHEAQSGRPFIGQAGEQLQLWLHRIGLTRDAVRIENVVEVRPDGNKLDTLAPGELEFWLGDFRRRMRLLDDPIIVVPMGNLALHALCGFGATYRSANILKRRGSIYSTEITGHTVKVIPMLHPAAVRYQGKWQKRSWADIERISSDLEFRELRLPEREIVVAHSIDHIYEALAPYEGTTLFTDIENPGGPILCVGLSPDPNFAVVVPTSSSYWGGKEPTAQVWGALAHLLGGPGSKGGQSLHYDRYHFARRHGLHVAHTVFDTRWMHAVLEPNEDHDLALLGSLYTRQPFWKDKHKTGEVKKKWNGNLHTLYDYNGHDCCETNEIATVLYDKLVAAGLWDFYVKHYVQLYDPLLDLMLGGVRVDNVERKKLLLAFTKECVELQDQITGITGVPLYAKVDLVPLRVGKWLVAQKCKLPKTAKTKQPQCDEVALRRLLSTKLKPPVRAVVEKVLLHRKAKKLSDFVLPHTVDKDGRMRSEYAPVAYTGRLSSSKNPMGTGSNAQNRSRKLNHLFLANPGEVIVEADASQGEDRLVKMYTQDAGLRVLANTPPWEYDCHKDNASLIFGVPVDAVEKWQRQVAKPTVHGANYGLEEDTLSDMLLTDAGLIKSPLECRGLLEAYHEQRPQIREWHKRVRQQLFKYRGLVNTWGRDFAVEDGRPFTADLWRDGYAFLPQSELAEWVNQYVFIPLSGMLRAQEYKSTIVGHKHDAIICSCPPEEAFAVADWMRVFFTRTRQIAGAPLTMFVEFKVGSSWAGNVEYKRLPSEAEFRAVAEQYKAAA